ncbi:MAG: N-acetyltransferase, partial [Planctomycetaceae bacterium]|nr:N-acetyltransferase [Planctomycetaceae bacterium]
MSKGFVHPTAIVDGAALGDGTRVWAYAHILPGARLGANCNVADHVFIEGGAVVGNNVTLKNNVCVWDGVTLSDDAFIGPNVAFTNDRFPRSPRMPGMQERYAERDNWLAATHVGRGCAIGANATILPGVTLGDYSFIAAGSLVVDDVPAFALVMGAPGRIVGDVCRCGRRLNGAFTDAVCAICGETPDERIDDAPQNR